MFKNIAKLAITTAALLALPGLAHAGTGTATGTSSLTVTSQCSVAGANVDLGSFTTNDTWKTVGDQLGASYTPGIFSPGSRGYEYLNFGSVTCDAGAPYTLSIKGTLTAAASIHLVVGGKTVNFAPALKKIGSTTLPDSTAAFSGGGTWTWPVSPPSATGTGTAQALLGSALLHLASSTGTLSTDKLAAAGTYTDTLTYTLNF